MVSVADTQQENAAVYPAEGVRPAPVHHRLPFPSLISVTYFSHPNGKIPSKSHSRKGEFVLAHKAVVYHGRKAW